MRDRRIDRAVVVCKKIVSLFSHSWKRQRALKAAQEELGLPQRKLVTESPTRWGSRQMMIQRLLEQEKAITQVLAAERSTRHLVLKWQDIDILEAVSKALGPLLDFTDALSSENYVTVSCLKPILHLFSSELLQEKDEDPSTLSHTAPESGRDPGHQSQNSHRGRICVCHAKWPCCCYL